MSVLLAFAGLGLTSCDDFLEEVSPSDALPVEDGFQNADDLEIFLLGAYSCLRNDQFLTSLPDLTTEDVTAGLICGELQSGGFVDNALTPDNRYLENAWFGAYATINMANVLMAETARLLENNDIVQEEIDRIEGEARFLRAVTYFQLVRLFANPLTPLGDDALAVPMPLSGARYADQLEPLPRSTIGEVYARIKTDLDSAAVLLESVDMRHGRASSLAARAYLAEVEFQRGKYAAALGHTQAIIDENQFSLVSRPEEFFEVEDTDEVIWSLVRDQGEGGGLSDDTQGSACGHLVLPGDLYARAFDKILSAEQKTEVSMNEWTVSDLRFTRLTNADTAGIWRSLKYKLSNPDLPMMRYAEILLMHAECLVRTGGDAFLAVELLNQVRERSLEVRDADGAEVSKNVIRYDLFEDFNNNTGELIEAIILERQVELLLEGNRFHDLMRLGRKINEIPSDDCRLRWPIPQAELDANDNISQAYPGEC